MIKIECIIDQLLIVFPYNIRLYVVIMLFKTEIFLNVLCPIDYVFPGYDRITSKK